MIPKEALLEIFDEDKTILMLGSKGSGKTTTAGVFMETLLPLGYDIWTNIPFFKKENWELAKKKNKLANIPGHIYRVKPSEIHIARRLSDTLLGIVNSIEGRKILFLDEAGIHAPSDRATSKDTKAIKDLNKIIRHFECCFVLLAQVEGDVPPNLREKDCDYQMVMKKLSKTKRQLSIGVRREVTNPDNGKKYIDFPVMKKLFVPLSHLPVDGKFPTGFRIDINLKETLDNLSELEDSIEIMDRGHGEEVIRDMLYETRKQAKYLSTGQYAKKYGISQSTVLRWLNNDDGNIVDFYQTKGNQYRILDEPPYNQSNEEV